MIMIMITIRITTTTTVITTMLYFSRFRQMSLKLASFPGVHFASVFEETDPKSSSQKSTLDASDCKDELEFTHHHHYHHPPLPTHPHHHHVDYTQMVQIHCQKSARTSAFPRPEMVFGGQETTPVQTGACPQPKTSSRTEVVFNQPEVDISQITQNEPEELGSSTRSIVRGHSPPEPEANLDQGVASLAQHCVIKTSDVSPSVSGDSKPDLLPFLAPSSKTTDHKSCSSFAALRTDGSS